MELTLKEIEILQSLVRSKERRERNRKPALRGADNLNELRADGLAEIHRKLEAMK